MKRAISQPRSGTEIVSWSSPELICHVGGQQVTEQSGGGWLCGEVRRGGEGREREEPAGGGASKGEGMVGGRVGSPEEVEEGSTTKKKRVCPWFSVLSLWSRM